MSMIKEFKSFAMRGNVVDLAVGIIIGAAFGKIVSSLVSDVLLPPIGMLVGGLDFSQFAITLKQAAEGSPAVLFRYGAFLNSVIDFLIVALAIFLLIRAINAMKKKEEEAPAAPAPPTPSETLLAEIRDLLKNR
jgi:large conductance mechanosensitive channel